MRSDVLPRSSSLHAPADFVAPRFLSIPDEYDPERTLGPEFAAAATLAGYPPDPEQQFLLNVAEALDKHGQPLIFRTVLIAPRQNLKTGFLKQRALGKLFVRRRPLVVWSAHEFDTARRALIDLEALIEDAPSLLRKVRLTSRGRVATHGAVPEITLKDGATLVFKTRTSGGARGLSGDDLFIDEAYAAQGDQMGAVLPIMLARPGAQVDFTSSACRPESAFLWDLIQQCREGNDGRTLYAEWCTPPPDEEYEPGRLVCDLGASCDHSRGLRGCGCDKPEVILLAHSAIRRGRILMQSVVDLRGTMPADEYPREIMGWHDRVEEGTAAVPLAVWRARREPDSELTGNVTLAVEVAEDHSWAALAAAGVGSVLDAHMEVVDYRPGAAWVVDRAKQVARKMVARGLPNPPVLVRKSSAAGALIPDLEAAGLNVFAVSSEQWAQACGFTFDALAAGKAAHLGQPELDAAVTGARRRASGDAFAWDQRRSSLDISPFGGCTLALWGHSTGVGVVKNAGKGRVVARR